MGPGELSEDELSLRAAWTQAIVDNSNAKGRPLAWETAAQAVDTVRRVGGLPISPIFEGAQIWGHLPEDPPASLLDVVSRPKHLYPYMHALGQCLRHGDDSTFRYAATLAAELPIGIGVAGDADSEREYRAALGVDPYERELPAAIVGRHRPDADQGVIDHVAAMRRTLLSPVTPAGS